MSMHFDEITGIMGWYSTGDYQFDPELCTGCGQPFTRKAWDNMHSIGEDNYHAHCCPQNHNGEDPEHPDFSDVPVRAEQVIASGYEVQCPVCNSHFHTIEISDDEECEFCGAHLDLSSALHAYD